MQPVGLIVFALLIALILVAIIVPQIQKRKQTEET
jgi:hypothetical protein